MDCDTTGVEPDFSLVKFKELVGGGQMTIVNRTIPMALRTLGYSDEQIEQIEAHVNEHATIIGAPELAAEHLPVFDVAVGERAISHMGHIKMMGAVQPFLSGAISKTVNLPQTATVEDIADAYLEAWRCGVKALAIYRDGSKTAQALRTDAQQGVDTLEHRRRRGRGGRGHVHPGAARQRGRQGGHQGQGRGGAGAQAHAGRAPVDHPQVLDRRPRGLHHRRASTTTAPSARSSSPTWARRARRCAGMMNSFATAISIALQYGVPLETLVQKFSYMRFDPEGITQNPEIPFAKSMPDYIMRWLASRFLDTDTQEELGILTPEVRARKMAEDAATSMASDTASPSNGNGGASAPRRAGPPTPRRRRPRRAGTPGTPTVAGSQPATTRAAAEALTDKPPVVPARLAGLDLGPACNQCGGMMQRTGSCYTCSSCGNNTGCG